jgi:DNA topoisomerase-1
MTVLDVVDGLIRSELTEDGIRRRRCGKGFCYYAADGTRLTDPKVLNRVRALVIPPAWEDVWICPDRCGHVQALGTDAAGRRQYHYHSLWREQRDREKFDRMLEFGRALPRIRAVAECTGKSGKQREQAISDHLTYLVVQALKRRRASSPGLSASRLGCPMPTWSSLRPGSARLKTRALVGLGTRYLPRS